LDLFAYPATINPKTLIVNETAKVANPVNPPLNFIIMVANTMEITRIDTILMGSLIIFMK
jgi:hypothetical protein